MSFPLYFLVSLTVLHFCVLSSKSEVTDAPTGFKCSTKDRIPLRKSVRHLVRRSYVTDEDKLWPGGVVPYELEPGFSSKQKAKISKAIKTLYRHTGGCITWIPHTYEKDFVSIRLNSNNDCSSLVGRVGGKQILNLGRACFNDPSAVVHEMMHALGFIHEHQRLDRDRFIRVYEGRLYGDTLWENVGRVDPETSVDFPYDINSVMHYDYEGSNRAIVTKNGHSFGPDEDGKLSDLDIWKLNHLYCGAPSYCEENPYDRWCRKQAF